MMSMNPIRLRPVYRWYALLWLGLAFAGGCDGSASNTPVEEDAAEGDTGENTGEPISDRRLLRRRPLGSILQNRIEDPNFTFQNDAWFASDEQGQPGRLQRVFATDLPEQRPAAGLLPAPENAQLSCMLGRMKWGNEAHTGSVWIAATSAPEVTVDLFGLSLDNAQFMASPLQPTGDLFEQVDGRTWERYEGTVARPLYGWGYLQVCSTATDIVWVGAPTVATPLDGSMALRLASQARLATPAELQRIEAFHAQRRKSR